jgi:3-oxoacyl-[acyl-carrier protein] reductase
LIRLVRYLRYYEEDMASQYWNETRAAAYRQFRYDFTETSLRGKTVIVSGGSGGLGAATVGLLAREGADLVVGYRANRERAEALRQSIEANFESKISLVEGDIAATEVRRAYLAAAEKLESPLAGVAIFPGDPARMDLENLNSETLLASLQSNYVGPILVAKEIGEVMEQTRRDGSVVLLSTMQALAIFPSSLNYAAPKAALVHAARILAQQWNHVRVNVVAPGATISGMATASGNRENTTAMFRTGRSAALDIPRTWHARYDFFSSRIITSQARRLSSTAA